MIDQEYNNLTEEAKTLLKEKQQLDDEQPTLMEKLRLLEETMQSKQKNISEMEDQYRNIL